MVTMMDDGRSIVISRKGGPPMEPTLAPSLSAAHSLTASLQSISTRIDALKAECAERWQQVEDARERGAQLEDLLQSRRHTKKVLQRAGHRAASTLNSLNLRLIDVQTKLQSTTEEQAVLSSKKSELEATDDPVLDSSTLFDACRSAVEAEATRNVIHGLAVRIESKAEEVRNQIAEKKKQISSLVQDALRSFNDEEIMTLHSQVIALKQSVGRMRADNGKLQRFVDERLSALNNSKARTAEMGRKLSSTEATYISLMSS